MHGQRPRSSTPGRTRASILAASFALLVLVGPHADLRAQGPTSPFPSTGPAFLANKALDPLAAVRPLGLGAGGEAPHLALDIRKEAWLLSIAGRLAVVAQGVHEPVRRLPLAGLDPAEIDWSLDREVVGPPEPASGRASNRMRDAAVLFPIVLSTFLARSSEPWRDLAAGGVVYAEALLITSTATHLAKTVIGRPRPGAYLPQPDRSGSRGPVPVGAGTFHSMPSSHASVAWTGAAVAFTSHLLLRPDAGWLERSAVGFVGGALAGAASALRVESGAHFPSDVVAGAGIGIASGVLVPLAHRGDRPPPSREAWLQTLAGTAAGTILGVLLGSR